ncbi:alanine--glyoxylate aminotransferase 2 homolog 3, mitochondrial [Tanacetum coccineum]|uniref:Alanine--glyoxylate aminotransferase 2 homolog 3, mitochondrial n=1 Tax=Tanacetum coccineum TaxID=301880 RepID=A0ABQ5DP27_9ASTR
MQQLVTDITSILSLKDFIERCLSFYRNKYCVSGVDRPESINNVSLGGESSGPKDNNLYSQLWTLSPRRALASKMPGDLKVLSFTNSGTKANELAMMIARLYTQCQDIISLRNAYHRNAARTMGATAMFNWKFNVVQKKEGAACPGKWSMLCTERMHRDIRTVLTEDVILKSTKQRKHMLIMGVILAGKVAGEAGGEVGLAGNGGVSGEEGVHVAVICGLARCNKNHIDKAWEAVKRRNGCQEMLHSRNTVIAFELIGLCWSSILCPGVPVSGRTTKMFLSFYTIGLVNREDVLGVIVRLLEECERDIDNYRINNRAPLEHEVGQSDMYWNTAFGDWYKVADAVIKGQGNLGCCKA